MSISSEIREQVQKALRDENIKFQKFSVRRISFSDLARSDAYTVTVRVPPETNHPDQFGRLRVQLDRISLSVDIRLLLDLRYASTREAS